MSFVPPALPLLLHAVTASQGSYSDFNFWVVALYLKREDAEAHRLLAEAAYALAEKVVCAREDGEEVELTEREQTLLAKFSPQPYETNSGSTPYDLAGKGMLRDRVYALEAFPLLATPEGFPVTMKVLEDAAREQGLIP